MRGFLRAHALAVIIASICALGLGLVSTAVVSLVGPCFQLLLTSAETSSFYLRELFGGSSSSLVAWALPDRAFTREQLFSALPLALLALATLKAVLYISQNIIWERLGELLGLKLRFALVESFIELNPNTRANAQAAHHEAELASLVATDVKMLRDYLVHFYGGLPRECMQIVFMGCTLVLLSPHLSAIFVLGLAPAVVVVGKLGKKLRRRSAAALSNYSELTEWLQGRLLGLETIKHYRTEGIEIAKFQEFTSTLFGKFLRAARIRARTSPFLEAIALTSLVVVLVYALREIAEGSLTSATAISFFAALALMCQSIATVGRYINSNREGAAAKNRINQALEFFRSQRQASINFAGKRFVEDDITVACEAISAGYPGKEPLFTDFSYCFKRGKLYAIVGPSGAGKSTLCRIILGLQQPNHGQIVVAEELVGTYPVPIGYVPQKIQLLDGTIAENISYPHPPPQNEEALWEALAEVGLAEFTRSLPAGIHTRVGARGYGLSGGQEQRLYLARLGFQGFPLAVIDEGTSALDMLSEEQVCSYLQKLKAKGMTILFITHRSTLTRLADEILSLPAPTS